jgi:hypothetical protein
MSAVDEKKEQGCQWIDLWSKKTKIIIVSCSELSVHADPTSIGTTPPRLCSSIVGSRAFSSKSDGSRLSCVGVAAHRL